MSYSASDFVDDIMNAIDKISPRSEPTDLGTTAEHAIRTIEQLPNPRMLHALKELRDWAAHQGGWDATCWKLASDAIDAAEAVMAAYPQAWVFEMIEFPKLAGDGTLVGRCMLNGHDFHITCVPLGVSDHEHLFQMISAFDRVPTESIDFDTMTFDGKQYVVVITPFTV